MGKVVIEDDVEVGSLSNIDRATLGETRIGRSTKIDSLVQIGHNNQIGPESILCSQTGIAGSCTIGKRFIAAGQAGVGPGIRIPDRVTLGARTGVAQDIEKSATSYHGFPEREAGQWRREMLALRRLPDVLKRLKTLEERMMSLTKDL